MHMAAHDGEPFFIAKWGMARDEFIEDQARAIEVRAWAQISLSDRLLGAHITRCSNDFTAPGRTISLLFWGVGDGRDAEVHKFGDPD